MFVDLREFLQRLMRGENLNRAEAAELLNALLDERATDTQIAATLVALTVKGETIDELAGLASAMRRRATCINSVHKTFIDTAGTGSSRTKTFNVSTAAAFVIAGAGLAVAKHGNRAATSRSGSADVLEALGVNVTCEHAVMETCLNEIGICFMFAPLYHASTKRVAAVRRELGIPTVFNLLGPLTNPACAPRQIIGVWHERLLEFYARVLAALGTERAWVVHGQDGLDEVTLSTSTRVAEVDAGAIRLFNLEPEDFEFGRASLENLSGGEAATNARMIRDVLGGARRDAARSLVIINAAAALVVGGVAENLIAAKQLAEHSIDSGAALSKLQQLIEATAAVSGQRSDASRNNA